MSFGLKAFRRFEETLETLERGAAYGGMYTSTGTNLLASYRMNSKITGQGELSYTHDDYGRAGRVVAEGREDDRWRGAFSINYQIQKWLRCGLSYSYTDNDSNFDDLDYRENRGMLFIRLAL